MPKIRTLTHGEVTALAAIVKKNFRDDRLITTGRIPLIDGYWTYLNGFRLAVARYRLQNVYRVEVWVHSDDTLIAETDGWVNWPVARLLFDLLKERRLTSDDVCSNPDCLRKLDEQLELGRKVLAAEAAAGKKPQA